MNYIFEIETPRNENNTSTLPMSDFFVKHELELGRYHAKKVENLIQTYSLQVFNYNVDEDGEKADHDDDMDEYLLLRNDFDQLLEDIRNTYISSRWVGLMSWLIDRALCITVAQKQNLGCIESRTNKNRSLLLKVLYDVNPKCFLQCFSKNIQ